jgi:hypothetical protein
VSADRGIRRESREWVIAAGDFAEARGSRGAGVAVEMEISEPVVGNEVAVTVAIDIGEAGASGCDPRQRVVRSRLLFERREAGARGIAVEIEDVRLGDYQVLMAVPVEVDECGNRD